MTEHDETTTRPPTDAADELRAAALEGAQAENEAAKTAARTKRAAKGKRAKGAAAEGAEPVPPPSAGPIPWANPNDPLEGLADRVRAGGESEALQPAVLDALAVLFVEEEAAYESARRELRDAGVPSKRLDEFVRRRVAKRRAEAKAAALAKARAEAAKRAKEAAREREAAAAEAAKRIEERPELAAHYGSFAHDDDFYEMEPGRITVRSVDRHGNEQTRELAAFSGRVVREVSFYPFPESQPVRQFVVSVLLREHARPFEVTVPAADFDAMHWLAPRLGVAAAIAPAVDARHRVRFALQRFGAEAAAETRYGYLGWATHGGRPVYVHAGGGIGEGGVVPGVAAELPAAEARYVLPAPPEGEVRVRAVRAVLSLLTIEPAAVAVPLACAVFRAPLGRSRLTLHVTGTMGTGKSYLVSFFARCFGLAQSDPAALPFNWSRSSTAGLWPAMRRVGDAPLFIDDFRLNGTSGDERTTDMADRTLRAHHNAEVPRKMQRDGTERADGASRGLVVSTGETVPAGHSLRSRMVVLALEQRPSPDLKPWEAKGDDLARGTAAYIRWLARGRDERAKGLGALERACAAELAAGSDRTGGMVAELLAGADTFLAFALDAGAITEAERASTRAHVLDVLRDVAQAQGERIAEEDPGRRAVALLRSLLPAGAAHATTFDDDVPEPPRAWGWRQASDVAQYDAETRARFVPTWRPEGRCIARVDEKYPGVLFVDPTQGLAAIRDEARREGKPFPITEPRELGKALHAAGMLAADEFATRKLYTKRRKEPRTRENREWLWVRWGAGAAEGYRARVDEALCEATVAERAALEAAASRHEARGLAANDAAALALWDCNAELAAELGFPSAGDVVADAAGRFIDEARHQREFARAKAAGLPDAEARYEAIRASSAEAFALLTAYGMLRGPDTTEAEF